MSCSVPRLDIFLHIYFSSHDMSETNSNKLTISPVLLLLSLSIQLNVMVPIQLLIPILKASTRVGVGKSAVITTSYDRTMYKTKTLLYMLSCFTCANRMIRYVLLITPNRRPLHVAIAAT